jgi:hypothetical protein
MTRGRADDAYRPRDDSLLKPSNADTMTFYMYRAQSDKAYPPLNTNTATLGGVLWYLHNEVVCHCPRRFDITRILRYKVTYKPTQPLIDTGRHFGVRYSFDSGKSSGPWEAQGDTWDKYGYVMGCNDMVHDTFPFPLWRVHYPNAAWYSMPGPCNSVKWNEVNDACKATEPGGMCEGTPTGAGNCTFSYEDAGEILLDEVIGIKDDSNNKGHHDAWCQEGCREYSFHADKGRCTSFWDDMKDWAKNQWRIEQIDKAFKTKYPSMSSDVEIPPPVCDFDRHTFYPVGHEGYLPSTLEERRHRPTLPPPLVGPNRPWDQCVDNYNFYVNGQ